MQRLQSFDRNRTNGDCRIQTEVGCFYLLLCFQLVLFVFWCFNLPKAFLFMGDVGSLALGGMYAMTSLYLDCLGPFIIMSGLFIFETLSVILQVFILKEPKANVF